MSDINFLELCTSHQEQALSAVSSVVEEHVRVILTEELGVADKGYTLSHCIDIHDAPISTVAMTGNPRRVVHNAIMTILSVVEQDEDCDDLTALLLDNGNRVPSREGIAKYIKAAEQMNRLAKVLSITLDARPESGAHPH